MKKILLIVLSCLMLTFCVSCGNKEQNGFEKSDALIDYITVYTADGNLEGYMDFEYDDDGKETKYGFKTPDNNWNWYFLYTYDENGYRTEMSQYDGEDNWLMGFFYENDENGNCIKETVKYNDETLMSTSSTHEYDGENRVKTVHFDGAYSLFKYDEKDNMLEDIYYTADGTLVRTYFYEYDKNGNMTKTAFVNSEGSTDSYSTYEYNNKGETTFGYDYNENGELINKMEYHYIIK